jgi:hypothetical protein
VTRNAVNRNAHDLGIIPFKVGHLGLISRHLDRSDWGPVQGVENQNDVFLPLGIAQSEFLTTAMSGQLEIRGAIADLQRLGPIGDRRSSDRDCHGTSSFA